MRIQSFIQFGLTFLLVGCSVIPSPISQQEVQSRIESDLEQLSGLEAPLSGPISIHEAMARALAYNLDLKLERYKSNLIEAQLNLSRHDQLPVLVASHVADD